MVDGLNVFFIVTCSFRVCIFCILYQACRQARVFSHDRV